jgi:hypothetical protein
MVLSWAYSFEKNEPSVNISESYVSGSEKSRKYCFLSQDMMASGFFNKNGADQGLWGVQDVWQGKKTGITGRR